MFKRFSGKPVYTEDPGLFLDQLFNLYPCATIHLGLWQFKNPPDFFCFFPEVPPPFWTVPAEENRAARLTDGEGGPVKGGVGSRKSLRLRRGTTRRRWWPESAVHMHRRASSSAVGAPAYPRRHSSIQGHGKLHGALRSLPVQGIEESLTVELGLRSPAVGWSPVTLIWCLQRGRARFLARGASLRHVEILSRVGWGWEGLSWPVYGGGCSGGRWHAVCRANAGDLALRWGRERAGAYGWSLGWLYRRGHGQWHGLGLAWRGARRVGRRACSGEVRARRTCGGVFMPLFKRLLRSQTCESWQKSCADLFLAPRAISCLWVPMGDMP
jgi:hypothetical protein